MPQKRICIVRFFDLTTKSRDPHESGLIKWDNKMLVYIGKVENRLAWMKTMNEIDPPNRENESAYHSLILRCWRDSLGELRGQLINPITNSTYAFVSASGMHRALDRAVDEIPFVTDDERKGSETDQK